MLIDESFVRSFIEEKLISDSSDGTKQMVRQKYERVKLKLEKRFAEAIAPDQIEVSQVLHSENKIKEQNVPSYLKCH